MNITKCSFDRKKIYDMDLIFIELLMLKICDNVIKGKHDINKSI